jgi:hypothetical protein
VGLAFRNLELRPDAPVALWPTEAVRIALERGDLGDWHRLAVEIGREPWGPIARKVEEVLRADRPYGVTEAMAAVIERSRARAEAAERAAVAAEIAGALARTGFTRAELASRLGTSASRLSTYLSGKVMPSATLLVRLRQLAGNAERR